MARSRNGSSSSQNGNGSSASLGFEAKLWLAADKLRSNMDAAVTERSDRRRQQPEPYKHVVLGLIFLKYISDTFEEHRARLVAGEGDYKGANPEDQDEYKAENIFWVPPGARWSTLQNSAKQPTIGKVVDDAMVALERDNPRLKGVLPKDYARPGLDKHRLGELIDLIGTIGLGDQENRSKDILGRVYEYFLTQFDSAEGKNGGLSRRRQPPTAMRRRRTRRVRVANTFYTPSSVVRLLVEMLAPYKGRVYDPACGSGGMFVQSEYRAQATVGQFVEARFPDLSPAPLALPFMHTSRARSEILVSTTSTLEGYTITDYLGVVSSHVVAGTGFISDSFAGLTDIFGGRSGAYQKQLAAIDREAIELLQAQARNRGGNALVGLHVDHDEISGKGKAMFMCTAQATVIRAVKCPQAGGATNGTRHLVEAEALGDLARRKALLAKWSADENSFPDAEDWKFLVEQRATEFASWLINRLAREANEGNFKAVSDPALTYLAVLPRETVAGEFCAAVARARCYRQIIQLIDQLQWLDLEVARAMINEPDDGIARRGVALMQCHQRYYSASDLTALREIMELIEARFPRLAAVVEEKGLFGKKTVWHCPSCKKAVDAHLDCCECLTDPWGFKRSEISKDQILERIRNRMALLAELTATTENTEPGGMPSG